MGYENFFFQKFNFLFPFRLLKYGKITEKNFFHSRFQHIHLKNGTEKNLYECYINRIIYYIFSGIPKTRNGKKNFLVTQFACIKVIPKIRNSVFTERKFPSGKKMGFFDLNYGTEISVWKFFFFFLMRKRWDMKIFFSKNLIFYFHSVY